MKILKSPSKLTIALLSAGAALALIVTVALAPRPASALPAYAQQTGQACGACHKNPSGGGPLTATGQKFQKNGHKM